MIYCRSFRFRAKAFKIKRVSEWRRQRRDENFRVVKASEWRNGVLSLEMSSGWRAAPGRLDVAEATGWTFKSYGCLGELLGNLDTCHHPDTD